MESSLLSISYCAASFSNEYKTAQRDRTENTNQHNDFNFANIYLLTYFALWGICDFEFAPKFFQKNASRSIANFSTDFCSDM